MYYNSNSKFMQLKGGEKSMSKIVTIRLDDKNVKKMKNFCEKNEIKQSKLIISLIENFFRIQEDLYE